MHFKQVKPKHSLCILIITLAILIFCGCSAPSVKDNVSTNDTSNTDVIVIGKATENKKISKEDRTQNLTGGIEKADSNNQTLNSQDDLEKPINNNNTLNPENDLEKPINNNNTLNPENDIEKAENNEIPSSSEDDENQVKADDTEIETEARLLSLCGNSSQLITVEASGSSAKFTVYDRLPDDTFEKVLSTDAKIGKNGIGKTREGDKKTPTGNYHFTMAFGKKPNPGCQLAYTQLTPNHVWVDDSNSAYYNRFVDTSATAKDWTSAEALYIDGSTYSYALALDYNPQCIPQVGSAIFLHCLPTAGYGCIAIPEDVMRTLLPLIHPDCVISIY